MIKITIRCEPEQWREHLFVLVNGLTSLEPIPVTGQETISRVEGGAAPGMNVLREAMGEPQNIVAEAAVAGATLKPEENPGRRRRQAKAEAPPAAAISTGAERVDPQDTADEAAERAASAPEGLTLVDVRRLVKAYGDKFGHDRAISDMPTILGCRIPELGDTQEALGAAVAKLTAAVAAPTPIIVATKAPEAPEPTKTEVAKKPPKAEPIKEPESLFGDAPAPAKPEPLRATLPELQEAGVAYAKKYDPSAADPLKSKVVGEDFVRVLQQEFGADVKNMTTLKEFPGELAVNLGRAVTAFRRAIEENPFKR